MGDKIQPFPGSAPHFDSRGQVKHYCTRDYCPDLGAGSMVAAPAPPSAPTSPEAATLNPDAIVAATLRCAEQNIVAPNGYVRFSIEHLQAALAATEERAERAERRLGSAEEFGRKKEREVFHLREIAAEHAKQESIELRRAEAGRTAT